MNEAEALSKGLVLSKEEVAALQWYKSTRSGPNCDNCVELALHKPSSTILMRDSKSPSGPFLKFTPAEIGAFFKGVEAGEFDEFGTPA